MSYNKYNARNSGGRFNNRQFVSAGVLAGSSLQQHNDNSQAMQFQADNGTNDEKLMPPPPTPQLMQQPSPLEMDDVEMAQEDKKWIAPTDSQSTNDGEENRPSWMKVKKISNKERRRRQNEHLRRLLTPKSAVMVLNEMLPRDVLANSMSLKPIQAPSRNMSLCTELTIDGIVYKGFGDNKVIARNSAAEQALRDMILKKMSKLAHSDANATDADGNSETIPMIQLASFALYKLFEKWESEGHNVPLLRPPAPVEEDCIESDTGEDGLVSRKRKKVKKPKVLPSNASKMHPCMLLTYMRPALEYRDVSAGYDRAQNMLFTVALEIDGDTYIGKASSKREARKEAARAACQELFRVQFETNACELVPAPAPAP